MEEIQLQWSEIKLERKEMLALQQVLLNHEEVFNDELCTLNGTTATLHVPPDVTPRFFRPRSVPYALRER